MTLRDFFKKAIFILYVCLVPAFFSCTRKSAFVLDIPDFYPSEVMESSSQGVRYFSFTPDQKGSIENFFEANGDASLLIKLTPVKVKNKIWVYIDIEGNSVLISPQNCDCKDIDEKYRTVDTVIFQKNVENKNVISAKNTFICENNSKNEVENSINIKNKTVIISRILKRRTFIWQN